ncbi:MAG: hypothetical protein P4L44_09720 [Oryzomonas sp.]|uniref:MSS51 C-terminal domain-containing protein n=1 Tax=Oryzomonas sp. TaxID=2855186 RepID=UPI00284005DF|nr:MSS51 C-terminal domain-containing protein [Oryzomonas sp.]MDR3580226.1 hypothetical protein [Oryzomonas sp.]
MTDPIITQYQEWKYLLAALKDNPKLSYICTAGNYVQKLVLAAPLAISAFVLRDTPQLRNLEKIKILVIGAQWHDALDNGCWYQLISDFCGLSCNVEVTLVGPDIFMENDRKTRLRPLVRTGFAEAVIIKSGLKEAKMDLSSFDLFVFFHPGIGYGQCEWIEGALSLVVKTGKPIMATSYDRAEYEMEVGYLEAHGYSVEGEPIDNPFFIELEGAVNGALQWGRVLYKIAPAI